MPHTIIYREKYGITGHNSIYVRNPRGEGTLVQLSNGLVTPPQKSLFSSFINFFTEVFLPQGYPESVCDDYSSYQIWDTIQAFCSTISGILTTHTIMKSVGVGDATATALSATLTWVLKDGIGMIGRIVFAWWRGHSLDTDSKKWRLFADFLNDAAMFLELLLLPLYPTIPTHILCLTTSMKGIVGVAAGASRAAITQHHAIRGNNGDVSAKDGSQETCVNLVACTIGMALLSYTESKIICMMCRMIWILFSSVTLLHLFANYRAIKSLALVTFNAERLNYYLHSFILSEKSHSPRQINQWESAIVGISFKDRNLCGFYIKLGYSIRNLVTNKNINSEQLIVMADMFKHRRYLLLLEQKSLTIYVMFTPSATTEDVLKAYFHSVLVCLTLCRMKSIYLDIFKGIHTSNLLCQIDRSVKKINKSNENQFPLEAITITENIVDTEFIKLVTGIKMEGWTLESHSLEVDEWRGEWNENDIRESSKDK